MTTINLDTKKLSADTMAAIISDLSAPGRTAIVAVAGRVASATKPVRKAKPAQKAAKKPALKAAAKRAPSASAAVHDEAILLALGSHGSVSEIADVTKLKKSTVGATLKRLRGAGKAHMAGVKRFARWGTSKGEAEARAAVAKTNATGPKPKPAKRARKASKHVNGAAAAAS